jgi:hypothetical protein
VNIKRPTVRDAKPAQIFEANGSLYIKAQCNAGNNALCLTTGKTKRLNEETPVAIYKDAEVVCK